LIGPELVAGASDNDPTNVGTATVVGAQTVLRLSWVALLVASLLAVMLAVAAQVGAVGGSDLQSLTVKRYGRSVAWLLLVSIVPINVITIAAGCLGLLVVIRSAIGDFCPQGTTVTADDRIVASREIFLLRSHRVAYARTWYK
jgi:Mn2+/Fe2+ NRAMP family transporter